MNQRLAHRSVRVAALLAAACGTADPPVTDGDPVADDPSPYVVDAPEADQPTASLAEIGGALQHALDLTLSVSARPVQDAYDAAMTGSTYDCPYEYVTPDGSYWYDSCSTDDGAAFDGYVFAFGESNVLDPGGSGLMLDYWYAFGGASVTSEAGHQLELAGGATTYKAWGDSGGLQLEYFYNDVRGTFLWDGPEAEGTWLALGLDPDLVWQSSAFPELGVAQLLLDGGFSGFDDGWAVAYDENLLGHAAIGTACEAEPSGTIGVRAPDGTWYDVRFDGVEDAADPDFVPADCDGCGQAFFQGEVMGEVCADVSGLLAQAVHPW